MSENSPRRRLQMSYSDIQFTVMYDEEQHHVPSSEKLETANVGHLLLKK